MFVKYFSFTAITVKVLDDLDHVQSLDAEVTGLGKGLVKVLVNVLHAPETLSLLCFSVFVCIQHIKSNFFCHSVLVQHHHGILALPS